MGAQYFDSILNLLADIFVLFLVIRYFRQLGPVVSTLFGVYAVYNVLLVLGMLGMPVAKSFFQFLMSSSMAFDENMQPTMFAIIVGMLGGIMKSCFVLGIFLFVKKQFSN